MLKKILKIFLWPNIMYPSGHTGALRYFTCPFNKHTSQTLHQFKWRVCVTPTYCYLGKLSFIDDIEFCCLFTTFIESTLLWARYSLQTRTHQPVKQDFSSLSKTGVGGWWWWWISFIIFPGTSRVVQWIGLSAFTTGALGSVPSVELRSHKCGQRNFFSPNSDQRRI